MTVNYYDGRSHAVDRWKLVELLGRQCSPMRDRDGYVIGPDITGRLCHQATCFTLREAQERADRCNAARGPLDAHKGRG